MLLVTAVSLDNEELKDRNGEDLVFEENSIVKTQMYINGIPKESRQYAPMMLLVPHILSQPKYFSVSMVNIANVL